MSKDEAGCESLPAIWGIEYIELYVSDALETAASYQSILGLQISGEPRGVRSRDQHSIVMCAGNIRLRVTAPLTSSSGVAEHLRVHGEGVKDIALAVSNVDPLFDSAMRNGARAIEKPLTRERDSRSCRTACVGMYGDVVHTLIERPNAPWREASHPTRDVSFPRTGLDDIDHVAIAVCAGELEKWVGFYVDVFGLRKTHQEDVSTEFSAMRSNVVQAHARQVQFPIMEPARGKKKSQIDVFLESNGGPGVQHIAFSSTDIVASVTAMAAAGVSFLATPEPYYDALEARVGSLASELDALKKHGILVDRDANGLLLQVFTKPVGASPTLFFEVVERRGAEGFGSGNIRALFEAVERAHEAGGVA